MPISSHYPSKHLRHDLRINNISCTLARVPWSGLKKKPHNNHKEESASSNSQTQWLHRSFPNSQGNKMSTMARSQNSTSKKLQFSAENLPCHPKPSNGRCAFTRSHNQEGTRKPGIGTSLYLLIGTENQNPEETQVHHNSPYVYKLREGREKTI